MLVKTFLHRVVPIGTTTTTMIVTRESIQALMPNQTLTKIHSEPTPKAIRKLENELVANLIAVECPWGHNIGHLGELQDAATYLAHNGAPYAPPVHAPPAYPIISPGTATADREHLHTKNEDACKALYTLNHVCQTAVNQVAEAIKPVF